MPLFDRNSKPLGSETMSDLSFGAFVPCATLKLKRGLPLARPASDTRDSRGAPWCLGGGGQPATVSGVETLTITPFWPVKLPCAIPPGGAQFAACAAWGPPNSFTTSEVCGTSGSAENVTVWVLRLTVPTSLSATGGGNRSVRVGAIGVPVRYALPTRGAGCSGLAAVALPTGVVVFCTASAPRFVLRAGHGSCSDVDSPAASPGPWVCVVTTSAPSS